MRLLLIALLGLASCTPAIRLSPPVSGTWMVADTLLLGSTHPLALEGTLFRFTAERAIIPGDTCFSPTYSTDEVQASAFFRDHFGLPPGAVGFSDSEMEATQVMCGGTFWHSPGSWVLQQDSLVLVPWNEVFLRLQPEN